MGEVVDLTGGQLEAEIEEKKPLHVNGSINQFLVHYITQFSKQPYKEGTVIVAVLGMWQPEIQEIKDLNLKHTANK